MNLDPGNEQMPAAWLDSIARTALMERCVNDVNSIVMTLSPKGEIQFINAFGESFFGYETGELQGKPAVGNIIAPRDSLVQQFLNTVLNPAAEPCHYENFIAENMKSSGEGIWVHWTTRRLLDADGGIEQVLCVGSDISALMQNELAVNTATTLLEAQAQENTRALKITTDRLLLDEERLDALMQLIAMQNVSVQDICDRAMEEAVRLTRSEIGYLAFASDDEQVLTMFAWSKNAQAQCQIQNCPVEFPVAATGLWGEAVRQRRPVITNDYPLEHVLAKGLPEGHIPLRRHMNVPILDNNKVVLVAGVGNKLEPYDETDVRQLQVFMEIVWSRVKQQRIADDLQDKAELLDEAHDAIFVTDLQRKILYWNRSAETLYGYTAKEAKGRKLDDLIYPSDNPFNEESWDGLYKDGEWMQEMPQRARNNRMLMVNSRWTLVRDEKGKPQRVLVVNTDLTEQKQMEASYLRTQRLESLGTLASGIAHDLNNILAPIMMSIQLLLDKLPDLESQETLRNLESSANRGAQIVKQILTFARGVQGEKMPIQSKHLVMEMARFAQGTFPKTIQIKMECAPGLWMIMGDATQLHQVLLNLCINARDAMPAGGVLLLAAENVTLDDNFIQMYPDARLGPHVVFTVSDTGSGIGSSALDKIFDPFYTTKDVGRGTGLGLSTALGIVRSHGGFIHVYSEVKQGSRFKIFIPATDVDPLVLHMTHSTIAPRGSNETILVVDDETSVRHVMRQTLELNGYQAITAADGVEAVAMYAQHRQNVSVVITDMIMPDMDGIATIRAIMRINPNALFIVSSGMIEHKGELDAFDGNVKSFLAKPFTAETLLGVLAKVLGKVPVAGKLSDLEQ